MNDPLTQLHDIEGLDPIHWWPLAPGWWAIMIFILFILIGIFTLYWRRRIYKKSWQHTVLKKLSELKKNLEVKNAQATLIELSEIMRRIAMHRYSRVECAGLEGKRWLTWLAEHDPSQFDWQAKGKCLVDAPYGPSNMFIPLEDVLDIINAIERWVK